MTVKDNEVHGNSTDREVYNSIAFNLCKLGAQDKDLATSFKVCTDTIHNWKIAYKDFFESIKDGKRFYDTGLIESALVKKAVGYEFDTDTLDAVTGLVKQLQDSIVVLEAAAANALSFRRHRATRSRRAAT